MVELEAALASYEPVHFTPSQVHPTVPEMMGGENDLVKYMTTAFEMRYDMKPLLLVFHFTIPNNVWYKFFLSLEAELI